MTMTKQDHSPCLRCRARNALIGHIFILLQEDSELEALLQEEPDRTIHFVLDLRSLHGDALDEVEWDVYDEEPYMVVKDKLVEDVWTDLEPTIRMDVEYRALKQEFERLGLVKSAKAGVVAS
jgi:hypothetical protein